LEVDTSIEDLGPQHGPAITHPNQLETTVAAQASVAPRDPGANDQFIVGITCIQEIHFHAANRHSTAEMLIGFPAKPQLFHMTPADVFQPTQINLIICMT